MARPRLALVHNLTPISREIPFFEKIADHRAILQGYIDTHIARNHSSTTIENEDRFLKGWFEGLMISDKDHPDGERQLLIWEAMAPFTGRERIQKFTKGLIAELKSPVTVRTYLGSLRRLFAYVLEWPYIPSSDAVSVFIKYGRIEQPVLEYDYPVHVLDKEDEGFPLTGKKLNDFFNFVRTQYINNHPKKNTASRDYAMIVVAGTGGLRADEILNLDALGPHRDLFYEENRIQTRFGKATKGSGKRVRKTIFTPFAQATLKAYEKHVRPSFQNSKVNPALFLAETGRRITYGSMHYSLSKITNSARESGIELPHKFAWHSLRKSFATNFMQQHPDQIWILMEMLGHTNPSTLHRYVKHDRSYFDKIVDSVVLEMMGDLAQS